MSFQLIHVTKAEESVESVGWKRFDAAVRMDIAGGWSDTPPITYENGGAVLNMAVMVDGKVCSG